MLAKVNSVLPRPVERDEIAASSRACARSSRPTGRDTTRLRASTALFSPCRALTAIAGGKYTTYRVMARDAVDPAARDLGSTAPSTDRTRTAPRRRAVGRPRPTSPTSRRLCGRGATARPGRAGVDGPARPGARLPHRRGGARGHAPGRARPRRHLSRRTRVEGVGGGCCRQGPRPRRSSGSCRAVSGAVAARCRSFASRSWGSTSVGEPSNAAVDRVSEAIAPVYEAIAAKAREGDGQLH